VNTVAMLDSSLAVCERFTSAVDGRAPRQTRPLERAADARQQIDDLLPAHQLAIPRWPVR
ncbi:MAG: hypothetical protein ABWY12_13835, partial [Burkholderiales bacterium]